MIVLGLIPARGGSSQVKGKNKRLLAGRPLISYTIEEALKSTRLNRVILSTDSEEIRKIGLQEGVEAPFLRPKKLATNETLSLPVIIHCLRYLKKNNYEPDAVLYMQPTSPFRTAKHIDESIDLFEKNNVDSVTSMAPVIQHPLFMYRKVDDGTLVEYINMDKKPERRQDLPELWEIDNNISISKTSYLYEAEKRGAHPLNNKNFAPYFIEGVSTIDINTELDFQMAEFMMKLKLKGKLE